MTDIPLAEQIVAVRKAIVLIKREVAALAEREVTDDPQTEWLRRSRESDLRAMKAALETLQEKARTDEAAAQIIGGVL